MGKRGVFGGEIRKAFKLLKIICSKKEFSAKLLEDKMNVSNRTARRYINDLKDIFQENIREMQGSKGEYSWKDDFDIDDKILGSTDKRLLFALINIGKKIGKDKDFWKTFFNIASKYGEKNLNRIIFDCPSEHYRVKEIVERAILESKAVHFKYKKNKFYTVYPYQLVLDKGSWYLYCADKNDNNTEKTFSLNYIEKLDILIDEPFLSSTIKSVDTEKIKSIWQISNDETLEEITAEIKKDIAIYFNNKKIFLSQEIISKKNNGNLIIKFKVSNEIDFKMQVISWIPFIRILKPEFLPIYLNKHWSLKKTDFEF